MTFVCPECGVSLAGPVACPHDGAIAVPADDARAEGMAAATRAGGAPGNAPLQRNLTFAALRRRRLVVLGGIAVAAMGGGAAAVLATRDGPPRPVAACTASAGTFALQTVDGLSFVVDGAPDRKLRVAITDGEYTVDLVDFPRGTRWEVGGARGTVTSGQYTFIKAGKLADQLGDLEVGDGNHNFDPRATLALQLPDCTTHQLPLPPLEADSTLRELLLGVAHGPVLFQGETEQLHDPPRSLLVFEEAQPTELIGRARRARDVDAIAIVRQLPEVKQTRTCSGYTGDQGKPAPDITLRLKETEVVVYDRRTAKSLRRFVLPPEPGCPTFVITSNLSDTTEDSSVPHAVIKAALRLLVNGSP